jgi:hypothetical protein
MKNPQFPLWKMPIQWKNGLGGFARIFLLQMHRFQSKKAKKNPFQSAQSAQSVLPLYRHFPKRQLLVKNDEFYNQLLIN